MEDHEYQELVVQYKEEILKSWNWKEIKKTCLANLEESDHCDYELEGRFYLGRTYSLFPSNKHYAPWSTGVTEEEAMQDEAFREALEDVVETFGMYTFEGEGDPTDMFVGITVEKEEEENA